MKKLKIQEELEIKSIYDIEKERGIELSFSKDKTKFSLNYSQINSSINDSVANQCRGLILRGDVKDKFSIVGPTELVAFPMERFFNYGQINNVIDYSKNPKVLEKLDGSLCICYFDFVKNEWHIATRSCPEADIFINSSVLFENFTFRTLFEKALKEGYNKTFFEFTNALDKNLTYCFELCTPKNRVIVKHDDYKIYFLTARDLNSGNEVYVDVFLDKPEVYELKSMENLIEFVQSRNPVEHEGVVVVDECFNRIKIKHPGYNFFNKQKDCLESSDRNILEIILLGNDDDVLPFVDDHIKDKITTLKKAVKLMANDYDNIFILMMQDLKIQGLDSKKDFANLVNSNLDLWAAPLFSMRDGKSNSFLDFVKKNKFQGEWKRLFLKTMLKFCTKYS